MQKENKNKQTCHGIRELDNLGKCENQPMFEVIGLSAQYGGPNKAYLCIPCKKVWQERHPDGMNGAIMEYNRFEVVFKPMICRCGHPFEKHKEGKCYAELTDEAETCICKKMALKKEIKCKHCGRKPEEIIEYQMMAKDEGITPEQAVKFNEGTYNRKTGLFYCSKCYLELGQPLGKA